MVDPDLRYNVCGCTCCSSDTRQLHIIIIYYYLTTCRVLDKHTVKINNTYYSHTADESKVI